MVMKKKRYALILFIVLISTSLFYLLIISDLPKLLFDYGIYTPGKVPPANSIINVNIINAYIEEKGPNDRVKISADGKKLSFTVNFEDENNKIIKFSLKNIGNKPVILEDFITQSAKQTAEISIVWPNLTKLILTPNETSSEYSILVLLEDTENNATNSFSAQISYSEYIR